MSDGVPLKDTALSPARIDSIATQLAAVYPPFDRPGFVDGAQAAFPGLTLTERIEWVAQAFGRLLPRSFPEAVGVVLASMLAHQPQDSDFGSYQYAPHSRFIAKFGCRADVLDVSLDALPRLTVHFSAEAAVRPFINAFPAQTMAAIEHWTDAVDHRVRRLASECTRPRLPWAPRITLAAGEAVPILDRLYADPSRFVTRSVANHINDIAATDPALAVATLDRWQRAARQAPKEMDFIARHGLRQLVKSGYPAAFEFFGYSPAPRVSVVALRAGADVVRIGEDFTFEVDLAAERDERVVVDYALTYPGRHGAGRRRKVFKFRTVTMSGGERLVLAKRHPMRQRSTLTLLPGRHILTIQVNGNAAGALRFELRP
jgi:3-methyladenine DNA glycosylase AlkC